MWNRKLWGVEFVTTTGAAVLISELWDEKMMQQNAPDGAAVMPLLFTTRSAARAWCGNGNAFGGRYRAVRVVHTVRRIAK